MSEASRPVVVILGASAEEPPAGTGPASDLAEVRFAVDRDALRVAVPGADAMLFWAAHREWLMEAWPDADRLRWIQAASDGVDRLLFPALVASDVLVTNARGVFDDPIAEWVMAAILSFETGLRTSIQDTAAGRWTDGRPRGRVAGKRLLVVGPGPIGRATAVRARALGMEVAAVGRSARGDEVFGRVLGPDDLHGSLAWADHVLDALPLTPDTRGYFDRAAFAAMRPCARFYNVGRGATVDERALIEALRDGRLAGAALDVFEEEPLPADSTLWSLPEVIVSPHVCGDVEGWEGAVAGVFLDNLDRFTRGQPLRNVVDTTAGFGVG
ncbi:MAG: D-2-hydroxyacid dehydrogenase [Actinomycetota bacterium]